MRRLMLFPLAAVTLLLVTSEARAGRPARAQTLAQAERARDAAIAYLAKTQFRFGGFDAVECETHQMTACTSRPIVFTAVNALLAISNIPDPRVGEMNKRAAKLFQEQQDAQGLWDFYVKKEQTPAFVKEMKDYSARVYFPDFDDTGCIGHFLRKKGYAMKPNAEAIRRAKRDGLYITFSPDHQPPPPHKDLVDPVVNANLLMYLGTEEPRVCKYLNDAVVRDEPSIYYQDRIVYLYLIARAHHEGVACLAESRGAVVKKLQALQKKDGSFGNPLQTAAAVNALIYAGYSNTQVLQRAVETLLRAQLADGSWPVAFFFAGPIKGFGSTAVSTAIAAEALQNFSRLKPD